jgi:signal transduction histidine kinase
MMEIIRELERQLATAATAEQKIDAMNALAWELAYVEPLQAIHLSETAHELASQEQTPYQKGIAESLRNLGNSYVRLGKYQLALKHSFQALSLFEVIESPRGTADIRYVIGLTYRDLGHYFEALDYALGALQIYENLEDLAGQARALNIIGLVYHSTDDSYKALAYFLKSLQIYRKIDHRQGQGDVLNNISEAYCYLGDPSSALMYGQKSLEIHREIGFKRDEGIVLNTVGEACLALEDYEQALTCFQQALHVSREMGHLYAQMLSCLNLGDVCSRQSEVEAAFSWLYQALELAEAIEAKQEQFLAHQLLAKIYREVGDFEKALVHYEQFDTLKEKVFSKKVDYKIKSLETLYRIETAKKETEIYRLKNVELEREIADRKQAEAALQQANAALTKRLEELATLNRIAQTVATVTDLQAALDIVAEIMAQLFDGCGAAITLLNTVGTELTVFAHFEQTPTPPSLLGRTFLVEYQPVAIQVIRKGRSLVIPRSSTNPLTGPAQTILKAKGIQCLMVIPLPARAEIIGAIAIGTNQSDREFTPEEVSLAETIAGQIAGAIGIARLLEKERHQRRLAESQNKELDAFAHTVAHDLKNPLALIIGYTDFLSEYVTEIDLDELRAMIRGIKKTGYKAINIIDELLLLAGVRKKEVLPAPLDMAEIVGQARERLAYMIHEYEAEIILPVTWPMAMGYGPWIEEVWTNYLSNGLKYGGQPPRLHLGASVQADGMICFWIQDNGSGVTPQQQSGLFTEFSHVTEIRAEGHGLGLSIVRRIVEKLGGQVGIESDGISGHGSRFYFTLPACEGAVIEHASR